MKPKLRKIIIRTLLVLVILIPVAGFAHYLIFPHETRSILIGFSNFKKEGRIYYNASTPHEKIDSLKALIGRASTRVADCWGQKTCDPKFIYCEYPADFNKYSINPSVPAVTYLKLGAVIVLSADGLDPDIIAHEISHAELYERIGFYKFNYKIPSWFKHGLAMQNDLRSYYSEDTLSALTDHFRHLPDIKSYTSDGQFYTGTRQEIMLHYMAAKHEVKNWYTKDKLDRFIKEIIAGRSFDAAYGQ